MSIFTRVRAAGAVAITAGLLTIFGGHAAFAATPGFGQLFLDGHIVGTVVPPAHVAPGSGIDPFYKVTNGASGQLGIAGVGPGDTAYHGGEWEVFTVTFNSGIKPFLLESGAAVADAANKGDVTVTRQPVQDFRCPITSTAVG